MTSRSNPHGFESWITQRLNFRKQHSRRRFLVALYASWLVVILTYLLLESAHLEDKPSNILFVLLWLLLSAITFYEDWLMDRFLHRERLAGSEADERQKALRGRAHITAYTWLTTGITGLLLICAATMLFKEVVELPINGVDILLASTFFSSIARSAPNAVMAWSEEDLLNELA